MRLRAVPLRLPTSHAAARRGEQRIRHGGAGKPPGYDEEIVPVVKLINGMIGTVQEMLEAGVSKDRFLWCNVTRTKQENIISEYPDAKVAPHKWALEQVTKEMSWLCDDWQPERKLLLGEHAQMLKDVVEDYKEEAKCKHATRQERPPCHEGVVTGIRPHCVCKCNEWWEGESCNVPLCRPLGKKDFPFTDCGTEDDGCGGTLDFGSCEKELQLSDLYKQKSSDGIPVPPFPKHISKEMEPVVQIMMEMLKMARASMKYGGASDDKVVFCQNVERERKSIRKKFKYYDAQPHKWALDQAVQEIQWLCHTEKTSVAEYREQLEDHKKNLKQVLQGYAEMAVCQPGMAHCENGSVTGMRPACECKCDEGWEGEHCDVEVA